MHIKKIGGKFCVLSESGKTLGSYATKAEAEKAKRIEEVAGQGQGVGGPKQNDGGVDTCVCITCGATAAHEKGTPCVETACPSCGGKMIGQTKEAIDFLKIKEEAGDVEGGIEKMLKTLLVKDYGLSKSDAAKIVKTGFDTEETLELMKQMKMAPKLQSEYLGLVTMWKSDIQWGQQVDGQQLELMAKESKGYFPLELCEAQPDPSGDIWRVVLIEKGQSHNDTIYTDASMDDMFKIVKEADEAGEPIKCMAYDMTDIKEFFNHISPTMRAAIPEGFPKNVVGWYKNPELTEGKLYADLCVSEDAEWMKKSLMSAWKFKIKKPFGLSIDGKGELEEGTKNGKKVWYVQHVTSLAEVTVVTHPSAGGEIIEPVESKRFFSLVESFFFGSSSMNAWRLIEAILVAMITGVTEGMTFEGVSDEDRAKTILAAAAKTDDRFKLELNEENKESVLVKLQGLQEEDRDKDREARLKAMFAEATGGANKPADDGTINAPNLPEKIKDITGQEGGLVIEGVDVLARLQEMQLRDVKNEVDRLLRESRLPLEAKNLVREKYEGASEFEEKDVRECILKFEKVYGDVIPAGIAEGDRPANVPGALIPMQVTEDERTKKVEHFQNVFDIVCEVPIVTGEGDLREESLRPIRESGFRGIRDLYERFTGDLEVTGQPRTMYGRSLLHEAISVSDFATMLGNSMTKHMVMEYDSGDPLWKKIVKVRPINDFKQQDFIQMGEFENLDTVAENAAYTEFDTPTEETGNYSPTKRGNYIGISREAIISDDLRKFTTLTTRMGRAANRTLNYFVFDLMMSYTSAINDTDIYDGTALYTGAHGNGGSSALSHTTFRAGRVAMWGQQDLDTHDVFGITPKYLVVPIDLEAAAEVILKTKFIPGSEHNDINTEYNKAEILLCPYLRSDTNNWYLVADPRKWDTIELGFVQGKQKPQLLTADAPTVGAMFTNDQIRYRARHEYGGAVTDYRTFYGALV